jgi:hypothetical protein
MIIVFLLTFSFSNHSTDYYKGGNVQSLEKQEKYHITVINPHLTNAIDVLPDGRIRVLCESHPKQQSKGNLRTVEDSGADTSGKGLLRSIVFDEKFPGSPLSSSVIPNSPATTVQQEYQQFLDFLHRDLLIPENITTVSVREQSKQFQNFLRSNPTLLSPSGANDIQDRNSMKAPFWQPCNTNHLSDIFDRLFPQGKV